MRLLSFTVLASQQINANSAIKISKGILGVHPAIIFFFYHEFLDSSLRILIMRRETAPSTPMPQLKKIGFRLPLRTKSK